MNGIEIDESIIYHGDYQIESGFLAAGELLDQGVTAIFACNDLMALGCIRKARQLGLTPGKEISVIGFDDIHPLRISRPAADNRAPAPV